MNRAAANIHVQASVWARVVRSGGCILRSGARVQPRQDPGGTLRMNGVGKRERGRERERMTRWGYLQGLAESGNALFFTIAFIP